MRYTWCIFGSAEPTFRFQYRRRYCQRAFGPPQHRRNTTHKGDEEMVYLVRSARAQQGRSQAALPWAFQVATYLNENYPQVNVEVLRNINGPIDQVHWVARYESLAALEEIRNTLAKDDAYQELVGAFQTIFVLESAVDNIYATVP
jgi:hypothetical protein